MGFIKREVPFGAPAQSGKRSAYRITDSFLRFWFRYVEPNRSRLEARQLIPTMVSIQEDFPNYLGSLWEDLARMSVARLDKGRRWRPASRWWGAGRDQSPLEVDIVAESQDGEDLLVGEAKLAISQSDWRQSCRQLQAKIARLPCAGDYRTIVPAMFAVESEPLLAGEVECIRAVDVLAALR